MMACLQDRDEQLETELAEHYLVSVCSKAGPLIGDIGQQLLSAGGHRLRPALYFLTADGHGLIAGRAAAAAALELVHMATLIHDDIIDEAELRREKPAAYVSTGIKTALLAGDYLFSKAFSLLASAELREARCLLRIMADAVAAVCRGEVQEEQAVFDLSTDVTKYLAIIGGKTAALFAAAAEMGAVTSGCGKNVIEALKHFGYCFGLAYQLRDDIDDFMQPTVSGSLSGDLAQGRITMPLIAALRGNKGRELATMLVEQGFMGRGLEEIVAVVADSGGLQAAIDAAEGYLQQAEAAVAEADGLPAAVHNRLITFLQPYHWQR